MNDPRQQAFLRLKSPCVHLSSVALRFRTKAAPIKDVLHALESVRDILEELGKSSQLDPKLAEYAFFPLAQQVFNEARRLSPRCLELASECVTLLVTYGYRNALLPDLGKQLLILMSMLAGSSPNAQSEPPTDELKIAAFQCISSVITALGSSKNRTTIFEDQSTKNVVDQLIYLLLEAITDSPSDQVQTAASDVLVQLVNVIQSRVFLASLLPRTVSSLTKALKPSTKARRTQTVLVTNLKALRRILEKTVSDRLVADPTDDAEKEALGPSWLNATTGQVKNALVQVCRLRSQNSPLVRRALEELCVLIIEECHKTLTESIPVMLETLVVLASMPDGESAGFTCRHLMITYPDMGDMLRTTFTNWCQSLPRAMSAQDEKQKKSVLQKIAAALPLLSNADPGLNMTSHELIPFLVAGITNMIEDTPTKAVELSNEDNSIGALVTRIPFRSEGFDKFVLSHESQTDTMSQLHNIIINLRQNTESDRIARYLVDSVIETEGSTQLASFWFALQLLKPDRSNEFTMNDFLEYDNNISETGLTRSSLLSDLHASTLHVLSSVYSDEPNSQYAWQIQALAIETVVLYAQTFPGNSYRPELMETLYPVLSFLGSPNHILRSHVITALSLLAQTCQYSSTQTLLIENVDYLTNSIAWKLNTYNLSPEAPQILRMLVNLTGAALIPYLDDLIQSIFAALDNYHGYPEWVELLFQSLKAMVDASLKEPQLVITQGKGTETNQPTHLKQPAQISIISDILADLSARKRRKLDFDRSADEPPSSAPHRPWTNALDGPSFPKATENDLISEEPELEDDEHSLKPQKNKTAENDDDNTDPKPLSKPHSLLLSIATSTVPHLASPSPRVRHLLLDLLKDISPLLSTDENSFLPLINAIWPVIVPRLFSQQSDSRSEIEKLEGEAAYNIAAAADTITVLCINAGDFMSSRIEEVFSQLVKLFEKVSPSSSSKPSSTRKTQAKSSPKAEKVEILHETVRDGTTNKGGAGISITGPVDLQIVKAADTNTATHAPSHPFSQSTLRTTTMQIHSALTNLLVAIISHVQVTLDTGDAILRLLLPLMDSLEAESGRRIRDALERYNADTVWLYDYTQRSRWSGVGQGGDADVIEHEIPVLRPFLAKERRMRLQEL